MSVFLHFYHQRIKKIAEYKELHSQNDEITQNNADKQKSSP